MAALNSFRKKARYVQTNHKYNAIKNYETEAGVFSHWGKVRKHMTLRVRQVQSSRRLRKHGLNQKETQVAGYMEAAEKLRAPRPGQLVLSYFPQSPGRARAQAGC